MFQWLIFIVTVSRFETNQQTQLWFYGFEGPLLNIGGTIPLSGLSVRINRAKKRVRLVSVFISRLLDGHSARPSCYVFSVMIGVIPSNNEL